MKTRNFLILVMLIGLASCGSHKNCESDLIKEFVYQDREVIREVVVHDTIFKTKADTSSLTGKLSVDAEGNVSFKPIRSAAGDHLNVPSLNITDNILTIDCEARAQELFAQWKSENVTTTSNTQTTKTVKVPIYFEPTGWQTFLMWTGGVVLLAGIVILIGWALYLYKNINLK